ALMSVPRRERVTDARRRRGVFLRSGVVITAVLDRPGAAGPAHRLRWLGGRDLRSIALATSSGRHLMDVAPWVWWTTIAVTSAILLFDVVIIGRRPHTPSMKE